MKIVRNSYRTPLQTAYIPSPRNSSKEMTFWYTDRRGHFWTRNHSPKELANVFLRDWRIPQLLKSKTQSSAGDMAQVVEHFPSSFKALSSNPNTTKTQSSEHYFIWLYTTIYIVTLLKYKKYSFKKMLLADMDMTLSLLPPRINWVSQMKRISHLYIHKATLNK
jgi:hypothetical protein